MNKIKYDNTMKQTIQKKSTNDYNIDENKKPPCLTTERSKVKRIDNINQKHSSLDERLFRSEESIPETSRINDERSETNPGLENS